MNHSSSVVDGARARGFGPARGVSKRQARNRRSVYSVGCTTGDVGLQTKKDRRRGPRTLDYMSEAGRQRRHTEEPTAVRLVIPTLMRMLHMVQVARMLLISGLVVVVVADRVFGVGQAINSILHRREGDRDWRCNKGKDRRSGDPDRHSKQRPSHQRCQHAFPGVLLSQRGA